MAVINTTEIEEMEKYITPKIATDTGTFITYSTEENKNVPLKEKN